jgi:hypothetical protein
VSSVRGADLLLAALLLAGAAAPAEVTPAHRRLLAAADPFARVPDEARIALVFAAPSGKPMPLEIWRRGDDLALVRMLAPKELGKFVLRRGAEAWLLTPGARQPVRLAPTLAPAGGAALDQLLGLRLERDYEIEAVDEQAGVVTFDLRARDAGTGPPRLRWVVHGERALPLRVELRDAAGRVERLVEFRSWLDAGRGVPGELVVHDVQRRARPLAVAITAFEAREVPEALFALEDPTARHALPPPAPAAGSPKKEDKGP